MHYSAQMISIFFILIFCLVLLLVVIYRQSSIIRHLEEQKKHLRRKQEISSIKSWLQGRDKERFRIMQDWHDGMGNSLATLRLLIDSLDTKDTRRYQEIIQLMEETQKEFSQITSDEMKNAFEDTGSVNRTLEKWQRRLSLGNIRFEFEIFGMEFFEKAEKEIKHHLYRITLELLNNALRHSRSDLIRLCIRADEGKIRIQVIDNGIGLKKSEEQPGILHTIKNRLKLINGDWRIQHQMPAGFGIDIIIPLY